MKLLEAKEGFFNRKKVTNVVDKATHRNLSKFGAFTRQRGRTSIRRRKGISEAGEPPSSHTDLLREGILFSYERQRKTVVIGPIRLNQAIGNAPEALEYGGESEIATGRRNKRRRRRVRIAARPYMRPAFAAELEKIPDTWRNSVRA